MKQDSSLPSRTELDRAFHLLQDAITVIAVEEEQERVREEQTRQENHHQNQSSR